MPTHPHDPESSPYSSKLYMYGLTPVWDVMIETFARSRQLWLQDVAPANMLYTNLQPHMYIKPKSPTALPI